MKNSVTDNEVISVISSNHAALSIDAIASNLGVLRHTLNPVIGSMLNRGILSKEIDNTQGIPLFKLVDSHVADAEPQAKKQDQANLPPNVSRLNVTKRVSTENTKTADKPADAPKAQTAPKSASTQKSVSNSTEYSDELKILAFLRLQARSMDDLAANFGKCEEDIEALKRQDLVESTYIIDQYVFMLNHDNVFKKYPELKDEEKAKLILAEPTKAEARADSPKAEPAAEAKVDAPLQKPEVEAPKADQVVAKEPEVVDRKAAPSPAEKVAQKQPEPSPDILPEPVVVREEYSQDESEQSFGGFNDSAVMEQISSLVKKLVQRQLNEQQSNQQANMSEMALKIRSASESLKQAARSLDEAMELLES